MASINVFGGGSKLFENRADGRDLFKELREKGYQTPRSWEELAKIQKGKVFCVTDTVDTPLPAERGDLLARASMKRSICWDKTRKVSS